MPHLPLHGLPARPQPDAPKNPRAVAEALLANLGETEGMVAETSLAGGAGQRLRSVQDVVGCLVAAGWLLGLDGHAVSSGDLMFSQADLPTLLINCCCLPPLHWLGGSRCSRGCH